VSVTRRRASGLATLLLALSPAIPRAAAAPPSEATAAALVAVAGEASQPIRLDGRLDEPAWAGAALLPPLTQVEPDEGAAPSEATEVRVLHDEQNLYFGIRCLDRTPSGIAATRMGHDAELGVDDHLLVVLDTFGDRRNGFFFGVNPRGARAEGQISNNDEELNFDWDGIWDAAARQDADGWTAELAIPFKTLRFRAGHAAWGLNVQRRIQRRLETDRWAAARRDVWLSNLSEAGRLEGLSGVRQGRGLDVRPYVLAAGGGGAQLKLGGDLVKNLAPNLTAALTLNTDFAETEVDARQVNLTRFPLFYPEKRSFFLEGAGVYDTAGLGSANQDLQPFYSRRIGLYEGREVPILGGLKLSGRVDRWNVGVLDVETGRSDELSLDRQNLLAARVSRNLFRQSYAGAIVTHGNPAGGGTNTLVGADAHLATSSFRGDKNLSLDLYGFWSDDQASGRRGHALGGKLDYPNDLWDTALSFKEIDDGFRPALGFVSRTGVRKTTASVSFMPRPGRCGVRQLFFQLQPQYVTDLDGRVLDWMVFAAPLNVETESGDRFELNWIPQYERLDAAFEIQPGVVIPAGEYRYTAWRAELETAARRRLVLESDVRWGSFYDGELTLVEAQLTLKPSGQVLLGAGGEWSRGSLPAGRFTARVVSGRLDLNFSPNLGWSTLVQYDTDSRVLGGQSRLRWRVRPGSDVFVVLDRGWLHGEDGVYRPYFERGSAKLQHTLRW
jgi:hypothetical protein